MLAKEVKLHKKSERTETQVLLAQYFTPAVIADYMSSLFKINNDKKISVLDAGAGEGILGLALLASLKSSDIDATFIELDKPTYKVLEANTASLGQSVNLKLINNDFIDEAFSLHSKGNRYTHIIINPPYFKLRVDTEASKKLRHHGIQVTNIYAAFVWLSAMLLEDNGQLVAIIPRSFCNGPYFLKFRQYIAEYLSIDTIHIFGSRNKAFAQDNVLQENIIIHFSKRKQTSSVKVTYSTDQSFSDIATKQVPIDLIRLQSDEAKVIHIPAHNQTISLTDHLKDTIQDLGVSASTGPVVDFRAKENILVNGNKDSVPLLYPAHMSGHEVEWPLSAFSKQGQHYNPLGSNNSLLPLDGYYVVVRRFSSKEEKRRIFASVVSPENFKKEHITFENHLNYFHAKKHGFDKDLAYGLCAYLNSSVLDEHFRKVSGHTQVNVSDLNNLPYPSQEQLRRLGGIMQNIDGLMDDIVTREVLGAI